MRIYTHSGRAHFDEVLACSLLLAECEGMISSVERVSSYTETLNGFGYVVDVGGTYDPARLAFDHHQDTGLPAAYVLVARHLGYEVAMEQAFPWWGYRSTVDCQGPFRANAEYGVVDAEYVTGSPVEGFLLDQFSMVDTLEAGHPLFELLQQFGAWVIAQAEGVTHQLVAARKAAVSAQVGGKTVVLLHDDVTVQGAAFAAFVKETGANVLVQKHQRGGYMLTRIADAPGVDFRWAAGAEGLFFTHGNGFCCAVEEMVQVGAVLALAIRPTE